MIVHIYINKMMFPMQYLLHKVLLYTLPSDYKSKTAAVLEYKLSIDMLYGV